MMSGFSQKYLRIERRICKALQKIAVKTLIYSFSVIYIWYGVLKMIDRSAAEPLVRRATDWMEIESFMVFLGLWEVCIGIFFLWKKVRRFGVILLFLQFPGTFLPLFLAPTSCFKNFPFILTLEGKYIFKNLILVAAGLVIASHLYNPKSPEKETTHRSRFPQQSL